MSKKTVFVGLSGGVDSSVAAKLLQDAGYEVVGVYMKNWSKDLRGMKCPWAEDLADAKRVAVRLMIDFLVWDFEEVYFDKVVKYMLDEYKLGKTPNPDVICNQEIKFKLFFDECLKNGADYVATGHYAKSENGQLMRAKDEKKDQTYFLYRVERRTLERTIFPLGDLRKTEVKQLARDSQLHTADRKESMGVCFVGDVEMRDFLGEYFDAKYGEIIDEQTGKVVGHHKGALFYTLGQRHGLYLGGGLPYYVSARDIKQNKVFVTTDLNCESLWKKSVVLEKVHFISGKPSAGRMEVRVRHQAPLVGATLLEDGKTLVFDDKERALSSGQSIVFYTGRVTLGGGVIS
ncbi:MAG: tRNA 2-thiouridine(34) synthase MnmA [Candidatus Nomurabacteria bacterium]|jgi:tRNA-specific 2-thiouridylase|nr:tRNA 2-thiouridine(34) synthase MnmA [Candidatus Nomurabacteria bacterium]